MANPVDHFRAASREGLPVEQGARDSVQLAISAMTMARDATTMFQFYDHLSTALDEMAAAVKIQRVEVNDFESYGEWARRVLELLLAGGKEG